MKKCPNCRTVKDAVEFFKNCQSGLSTYCKPCSADRKRKGTKTQAQLMSERYPSPGHKRCSTCQAVKPLSDFNRKSDGRSKPKCKSCQAIQFRDWLSRKKKGGAEVLTRAQNWAANNALMFPTATTKVCSKCKLEKPRATFRNIGKGKIAYRCNSCRSEDTVLTYRKDVAKVKRAAYRAANLDRVRMHARNGFKRRRALKKGALTTLSSAQWEEILDFYGRKCLKCGTTEDLSMDHIVPLIKGGSHTADNVQPLCCPCNSSKKTKIIDFRPATFVPKAAPVRAA